MLSEKAVVLAVEGAEVFLGLGIEDRVHFGDVLPVLRQQQLKRARIFARTACGCAASSRIRSPVLAMMVARSRTPSV